MNEDASQGLTDFSALLPLGAAACRDDLLGVRAGRFGVSGVPAAQGIALVDAKVTHLRAFLAEEQERRPVVSSQARTTAALKC